MKDPEPCSICKKIIVNAGIKYVYVRINKEKYKVIVVNNWERENLIGGY